MNKDYFIAERRQTIKVNNIMIDTLNSIIPVITKFDNKVYNKRLVTALKTVVTCNDIHFIQNNDRVDLYAGGDLRMVNDSEKRFLGYLGKDTIWLYIHFNKEGKIDAEKTIEVVNNVIDRLNNDIVDCIDCVENYDTYIKINNELIQVIKSYKEKVPNRLRLNITYSDPF